MPGNGGNSNFCYLCGSLSSSIAAADDGLGARMGIPSGSLLQLAFRSYNASPFYEMYCMY